MRAEDIDYGKVAITLILLSLIIGYCGGSVLRLWPFDIWVMLLVTGVLIFVGCITIFDYRSSVSSSGSHGGSSDGGGGGNGGG